MTVVNPEGEDISAYRIVNKHYADLGLGNWMKHELYRIAPTGILKIIFGLKTAIAIEFSLG